MEIDAKFGARLSELRIQKNVSAREMSLKLGQSESYINMIENGRSYPSMTLFYDICDFLEVTPSVFFDFDNHNPKKSLAITEKLSGLSDEQLSAVLSIIEQMR